MAASKQGAEIHRRLNLDEPVQHIADEMGLSRSQVHRHKRGGCSWAGKPPAPAAGPTTAPAPDTPEAADPWTPAPEAPVGNWLRFGFVVGQHAADLAAEYGMSVADVEEEITPETRRELVRRTKNAFVVVARRSPARWLTLHGLRDKADKEEREAAQTSIGPERMAEFLAAVIGHERTLLIAAEFPDFIQWLRELTVFRYPALAQVLEAAIVAEQKALENLVD